jgi:Chaperone of endosialidase
MRFLPNSFAFMPRVVARCGTTRETSACFQSKLRFGEQKIAVERCDNFVHLKRKSFSLGTDVSYPAALQVATTIFEALMSTPERDSFKLLPMKTTIRLFLALLCLSIAEPKAQAVIPPPDGGYPGGNTAEGQNALQSLTIGTYNTAVGFFSLRAVTFGNFNTGVGAGTLFFNNAHQNTAIGAGALLKNVTGHGNTANGTSALLNNTSGDENIALGNNAGSFLTTGNFNIDIGNSGLPGEANTMRIGSNQQTRTFIAGIRGVTTGNANAIPVLIDSLGQLGTASSSRRFKKEIKPMEKASEAILALEPVTFEYKNDKTNTPQYGLIAEQVADIDPDLVVRDDNGEIYTVRYDAVNVMLLNEFLKERRKNAEQQAVIARLEKRIEALAAGLHEVNAQVQLNKTAAQTAVTITEAE